jgi:hypothetical protein
VSEAELDTDTPKIEVRETVGRINSDLTIGADVSTLPALKANDFLASRGMQLMGAGFIVTPAEAEHLGLGRRPALQDHIRLYRNGRDLTGTPRGVMVIDLFGLDAGDVRKRFPEVYQHILATVKESKDDAGRPNGRDVNNRESYKNNWWVFGEPRRELRPALEHLPRYIATAETAKHRVFQFLDASILPDNMVVCMALDDAYSLGVLASRLHVVWALRAGGWLGIGNDPRYSKSRVFDPFPFPDASEALQASIRATAEELDALRKQRQSEHPDLTLTQIYNVLEKLRAGLRPFRHESTNTVIASGGEAIQTKAAAAKSGLLRVARNDGGGTLNEDDDEHRASALTWAADDQRIYDDGLVLIVKELHDKLDILVAEAYGWPADLSDEEILTRLVALNAERAEEERRGLIRWLRPGYQRARAGIVDRQSAIDTDAQIAAPLLIEAGKVQKPAFPAGDLDRTAAVFAALMQARAPLDARTIARAFRQGARTEPAIARILASLARLSHAYTNDGQTYALRRTA